MREKIMAMNEVLVKDNKDLLLRIMKNEEKPFKEKYLRKIVLNTFKDRNFFSFFIAFKDLSNHPHIYMRWKALCVLHTVLRDGSFGKIIFSHTKKMLMLLTPLKTQFMIYFGLCDRYSFLLNLKVDFLHRVKFIKGNYTPIDPYIKVPFKEPLAGIQFINVLSKHFDDHYGFASEVLNICMKNGINPSRGNDNQMKLQVVIPIVQDCIAIFDLLDYSLNYLTTIGSKLEYENAHMFFAEAFGKYTKLIKAISNIAYITATLTLPPIYDTIPTFDERYNMELRSIEELKNASGQGAGENKNSNQYKKLVTQETKNEEQVLLDTFDPFADSISQTNPFGDDGKVKEGLIVIENSESKDSQLQKSKENEELEAHIRKLTTEIETLTSEKQLIEKNIIKLNKQNKMNIKELKTLHSNELNEISLEIEKYKKDCEVKSKQLEENKLFSDKFEKLKEMYTRLRTEFKALEENHVKALKDFELKTSSDQGEVTTIKETLVKIEKQLETSNEKNIELNELIKKFKENEINLKNDIENCKNQHLQELKDLKLKNRVDYVKYLLDIFKKITKMFENSNSLKASKSDFLRLIKNLSETHNSFSNLVHNLNPSENENQLVNSLIDLNHFMITTLVCGEGFLNSIELNSETNLNEYFSEMKIKYVELLKVLEAPEIDSKSANKINEDFKKIFKEAHAAAEKVQEAVEKEDEYDFQNEINKAMNQVEEAAEKIQRAIAESQREEIKAKFPGGEKLLNSCVEFVSLIKKLVIDTNTLQKEIVQDNVGSNAEIKSNFYKKNHKWAEGLVSAAKSIGNGALELVGNAEGVIKGDTSVEELIVSLNGVTTGTIQLVTASKVKADPNSKNLPVVVEDSSKVRQAAAAIVAFARSSLSSKETMEEFDFSKLSMTKARTLETEVQIRILELEVGLTHEREKLGRIRAAAYSNK